MNQMVNTTFITHWSKGVGNKMYEYNKKKFNINE